MKLEFGILGPIEVRADGRLVRLGGPKQRALLSILLLHPNRVLSSERLVDLLWGHDAPASAANALQVHVSQLRRVLEPERSPDAPYKLLLHRPPGYLLAIEADQLDMHRFEALALDGHRALTAGDTGIAARCLRTALQLWRGAALADFPDDLFAVAARSRLEELRLSALEERIQADLASGQHAGLIGELQNLVAEHPMRERLCAGLMLALYRSGRHAEATNVFHRARRHLVEEMGLEPGPDLQSLLSRILNHDPDLESESTVISRVRAHEPKLPTYLTRFIGRRQDVISVKNVLATSRLVTLLGPGGIGKTRLALRVASQVQEVYPDGVWLVDLASIRSAELIAQSVLAALSIEEQGGGSPVEAIVRRLARGQLLLVVDNCEHVVDAAAAFIQILLQHCPGVTILATSRERLNLSGEQVWRVGPLSVPNATTETSLSSLMDYEAIQLFVDRAQAGERFFTLTGGNAPALAQLCRSLDGLPLALELAAANASVATPRDMLTLLEQRSWLPSRPARGTPARQRTLEAALDWSYDLLDLDEQALLRRLSVFAGQFALQTIEQVCVDDRLARPKILALLVALTDKSLVSVHETLDGTARYRLLNTVRQYGLARLIEAGEADEIARRHARHLLSLASALADAEHGPDAVAWMQQMGEAHADLTAALTWTEGADAEMCLRLATAAALFWEDRGYFTEGRQWLHAALLAADEQSPYRSKALFANGRIALTQGDYAVAEVQLKSALTAARFVHDEPLAMAALHALGSLAAITGDLASAGVWLQQSLEMAEHSSNNEAIARALHSLGQCSRLVGRHDEAHRFHARALEIFRTIQSRRYVGLTLLSLGALGVRHGDLTSAEDHLRESLDIFQRLGAHALTGVAIGALSLLAAAQRDFDRALRLASAGIAFAEKIGARLEIASYWLGGDVATDLARIRRGLTPEAAATAWEQGHQMSLDDVVAFALAGRPLTVG